MLAWKPPCLWRGKRPSRGKAWRIFSFFKTSYYQFLFGPIVLKPTSNFHFLLEITNLNEWLPGKDLHRFYKVELKLYKRSKCSSYLPLSFRWLEMAKKHRNHAPPAWHWAVVNPQRKIHVQVFLSQTVQKRRKHVTSLDWKELSPVFSLWELIFSVKQRFWGQNRVTSLGVEMKIASTLKSVVLSQTVQKRRKHVKSK